MKLLTSAPRGTQDILPKDSYKWRFVENLLLDQASKFQFKEIRTPVFEHTELFLRSVGQDTDVVQKEMYTFLDKGNRSITLRPEGTAGAIRAMLEHNLCNENLPVRLSYIDSCYRYEKPQSGRWREFSQFGCEMIGSSDPLADAEVISLCDSIFKRLSLNETYIEINSVGCPKCRGKYYESLKEYFEKNKDSLCNTCLSRLERNPMRILDCKKSDCLKIAENAPSILDFLCSECKEHFEEVKKYLDVAEIKYNVNPKIVRGLDYYTKTVFEVISMHEGSKGLVCGGGGRYDNLVEELGGPPTPALGFGLGIGRILLAMGDLLNFIPQYKACDVYFATLGEEAKTLAFQLANILRDSSFVVECDTLNRKLKPQMKYADKIAAKFAIVLGEEEINSKKAKIKNMADSSEKPISLDNDFLKEFFEIYTDFEKNKLLGN
ncbi:MAG: histidine--tRNA ligase [Clostridia bacterium]|nr:histidine--tRNA ligase [Clostridia bacterium]